MIIPPSYPPNLSHRSVDIHSLGSQLVSAAEGNKTNKINELLRNLKASNNPTVINYTDEANNTALMWASANGNIQGVNLLLVHKANKNKQNIEGYTALHWAVWNNHLECVKSLLESGADLDIENKLGLTAFQIAAIKLESCWNVIKNAPEDLPSHKTTFNLYQDIINTFFKYGNWTNYQEKIKSFNIHDDVKTLLFLIKQEPIKSLNSQDDVEALLFLIKSESN